MAFERKWSISSRRFNPDLLDRVARYSGHFFAFLLTVFLTAGLQSARAEPAHATFSLPDVWPWAYESEHGEQEGSLIALVKRLSELSGVPIRAELRPLRRVIREIRSGQVGFTFLFRSPELDQAAVPVGKVIDVNLMLLALASTDYPLNLKALAKERVAYIRGTYLGEAFEHDTTVVKVPVSSVGQAMDLLKMGRISAILASDHNILRTIQARKLLFRQFRYEQHVAGQPAVLYRSAMGGHPAHAEKFADALASMAQSGELKQIFFGSDERMRASALLFAQ